MKKCIVMLVVVALCSTSWAATWNFVTSYSTATNPTGGFTYGAIDMVAGVPFMPLNGQAGADGFSGWAFLGTAAPILVTANNTAGEALSASNQSIAHAYQGILQPEWNGVGDAAIRWVAPAAGSYQVYADFARMFKDSAYYQWESDVHVVLNGVSIFDDVIDGFQGSVTLGLAPTGNHNLAVFDQLLTLAAGDIVDVIVGAGAPGDEGGDLTGVRFIVSEIPEPATMMLVGLGSLVMLRKKRA